MLLIVFACLLSSILLSSIGCITAWYRYGTYSDNMMHVLMLAAIFSAIFQCSLLLSSCLVAIIFVFIAGYLQGYFEDKAIVLNIAATSLIAIGLIAVDVIGIGVNLDSVFFGDVLLVNQYEVLLLLVMCLVNFFLIYRYFNIIVVGALNEEIAISHGVDIAKIKLCSLLVAAISISAIVKIIGGLMITTLSIVPVFFARSISHTPAKMILNSVLFASLLSLIGAGAALKLDFPIAAMIAIIQVLGLFLTLTVKKFIV